MSEAIWIELIKVLPAFLWIGFGFIALALAKRVLTAQAPRMTKVETPWVTVELAQQAMELAAVRGPSSQVGADPSLPRPPWLAPLDADGESAGPVSPYGRADPVVYSPPQQRQPVGATPPANGPADAAEPQSPPPGDDDASASEPEPVSAPPQSPFTEPRGFDLPLPPDQGYLRRPPSYPPMYSNPPYGRFDQDRNVPPPYVPPGQAQELNAYGQVPTVDSLRGLRVARRLALSADRLQGGAILWVDDYQEWNEPLIRLFRTAGITVDLAVATDEALRALRKHQYDLVITDMRREREPDGDTAGMALLDRMIEQGVPTPAVFFSDHPNAKTAVHPRAVIATSDPEQLVDTVVDVLAFRPRSAAPTGLLRRLRGA